MAVRQKLARSAGPTRVSWHSKYSRRHGMSRPLFVHNRRRWPAAFVRLPIIPVCLPALLLRYPMRELDPPGRRGDIAAQQTRGNKKSDSDVKRTIHAARHGQLDQPQDKNDRDRRSPEGRKKGGMTGSKK